MNKNQRGFGIVELILIVLLVLGIGFVIWRVYDVQLSVDKTADVTEQASNQTVAKDKNAGYFVIKDWGVRFKPQTGLSVDDIVVYKGSGDVLNFTTKRVEALGGACDHTSPRFIAAMVVSRSKTAPIASDMIQPSMKIGDYYYYIMPAQSPCSDDVKTQNGVDGGDHALFIKSMRTLEASK